MPKQIDEKIHGETRDYILNVKEDDYLEHLQSEFALDPLTLDQDHIEVSMQFEKEVEMMDFGERIFVKRSFLTFCVPFSGERELFFYRPSSYTMNPPRANVPQGNELHLTLEDTGNADKIKGELDHTLQSINQYLSNQRAEIETWNQSLPGLVRSKLAARKEKLLKDSGVVESLGFPLRKREGSPTSYTVPVKKKISVDRPTAKKEPHKTQPQIDEDTYHDILKSLRDMALVMERSPSAFAEMDEENLRMHFLVPLNGAFEGDATGETFNHDGKTDILLRKDGRNVFIAECKFWVGPKGFTDTIDQLLNYLTWRDSKTAIIIFVRNTTISTVVAKIPQLLRDHPQFISETNTASVDEFRVRMKSARDAAVHLELTVQVYDVPTKNGIKSGRNVD
ncbi:MAG: hypothetical protein KA250_18660 [Verrucomicrobiales bacterium]|jgi:hypothetical protein|nr:hypothetical protein [Verrucomicrobiales bacterium]